MEMPDLPPSEKRSEERKQLKFWIDHCHELEKRISALEEDVFVLESDKQTALAIVHHWFPEIMSARSESYFAAGWLENLDSELVKLDGDAHDAAMLIGKIPTYWDGVSPVESATWRIYP